MNGLEREFSEIIQHAYYMKSLTEISQIVTTIKVVLLVRYLLEACKICKINSTRELESDGNLWTPTTVRGYYCMLAKKRERI